SISTEEYSSTETSTSTSNTTMTSSSSSSSSEVRTGDTTGSSGSTGVNGTTPSSANKVTPKSNKGKAFLPSTGEQVSMLLVALGIAGILTAIFLNRKKSGKE
ncbi:TPA: LPXTG cell wall anchor domain-containing protein, partial [Streptococcus suis]